MEATNNLLDGLTVLDAMDMIDEGCTVNDAVAMAQEVAEKAAEAHETDGMNTAEFCAWVRARCAR